MNVYISVLGCCLLLLVRPFPGSGEQVASDYNFGLCPFQIRSQAMGQSLRLTMTPIDGGKFEEDGFHFFINTAWTNVWADERRYFLDYEMTDSRIEVSKALSDRLALSVGFSHRHYMQGAMDRPIQGFHDLFGVEQNGRDDVPYNESRFVLYDRAGNVVLDTKDVSQADNNCIHISGQYLLHPGTTLMPAVAVKATVGYGLNNPPTDDDHEPLDYGATVGFFKRWHPRWYTHHELGYIRYGRSEFFGLRFEENNFYTIHSLEWQWDPKVSILLNYIYHEGALKDFGNLSDASHEIDFGLKWRTSAGNIIEFALIENLVSYDNSPDFGSYLSYEYRMK